MSCPLAVFREDQAERALEAHVVAQTKASDPGADVQ